MCAPASWIISMNSPTGGMSIFTISFFIIVVAIHDIPGMAPIHVGIPMPIGVGTHNAGLPTVEILIRSIFFFTMPCSPKKVKKSFASTPSSDPRETMIETLSILPLFINMMLLSHAADRLWIAGDLGRLFDRPIGEQGVEVLGRDAADLIHAAHSGHDTPFLKVLVDEIEDLPMPFG